MLYGRAQTQRHRPNSHVKLHFHPDELFVSFVSRFARLQGLDGVFDLLRDVNVHAGEFHKGDRDAITKVAAVLNVDPAQALARSFRRVDAPTSELLNLTFRERSLLRGQFRVCPACLRADIGPDLSEETALRAYARTVWSIMPVRVCPIHQMQLIGPPQSGIMHEFNQTWEPWLSEVLDCELDQPVAGKGLYEKFVACALQGDAEKPGWSGQFPLEALGMLSGYLGAAKLYGPGRRPSDCDPSDMSLATDAGFSLLLEGPDAVEALFFDLRTRPGLPQQRPQGRYGPIYDWLKRDSGAAPEFDPVRLLLRRHIMKTWPLGPGSDVLGDRVKERRLHSILTASAEYELRPSHVRNLLRDAQLEGTLDLPEFEKVYPAEKVNDILDTVSGSLSTRNAEIQLGMSRTQLETLISAGFLRYSLGGQDARRRFAQKDISEFNDRHREFPVANATGDQWPSLTIAEAARRHGKSVVEIYRLITDGALKRVYRASDLLLFSEIRIDSEELAALMLPDGRDEFMPMVAFTKELALGPDFIRELSAKGYLTIFDVLDERSRRPKVTMRKKEVNDFKTTYVSRRGLAQMNGVQVREIQNRVERAGLIPVEASADKKEFLFRVDDVRPVTGLNRGMIQRD